MLNVIYDMVEHEGLVAATGITSPSIRMAKDMGPPHHRDHPVRPGLTLSEQDLQS